MKTELQVDKTHSNGSSETLPSLSHVQRAIASETSILKELMKSDLLLKPKLNTGGVELEVWVVDPSTLRLKTNSLTLLSEQHNTEWVKELGGWNVECNFPPFILQGTSLSESEQWFRESFDSLNSVAARHNSLLLLGPMPVTARMQDLVAKNLTSRHPVLNPEDRYNSLDKLQRRLKGTPFKASFENMDIVSDSIILAATTTGIQPHLLCDPKKFVATFNVVQVLSPLLLALSGSSSHLAGCDAGFASSRISLLAQMHKGLKHHGDDESSRFFFGDSWLEKPLDMFEDNILVDPFFDAPLQEHSMLELPNLRLHNGMTWRFNRPVYDRQQNISHIRIESRVMDTSLSIIDNFANLAFFYGAVEELVERHDDICNLLNFSDIKRSFFQAAEDGLDANIQWLNGKVITLRELAIKLIDTAKAGLARQKIASDDIEHYISVIQGRVETGITGSEWIRATLCALADKGYSNKESQELLTTYCIEMQCSNIPVHEWGMPTLLT